MHAECASDSAFHSLSSLLVCTSLAKGNISGRPHGLGLDTDTLIHSIPGAFVTCFYFWSVITSVKAGVKTETGLGDEQKDMKSFGLIY